MKEYLVGHILFPFSNYMINRRNILSNYEYLCKSEYFREDELHAIQVKRLIAIIEYSYNYVPYYRRMFDKISLVPQDFKSLADLRHIPPLTRRDVIENYRDLVDSRIQSSIPVAEVSKRGPGDPIPFGRFRKHKLVRNTSSGSTGAPTMFFEDGSRTALNWAYELRVKKWYGIAPGSKEARMARLSTAYLPSSLSLQLRKILWNQLILPGTNLTESDYAFSVERIKQFRPATLWGYTSALTGLADYVKRNGEALSGGSSIQLTIAWAAPLHDPEKALLEEVFRCPATNIYGAREVGHIAAICPAGSFHVNQENLVVETEGAGNEANGTGELLVTNLDRSPMPFIRYRMGDIGVVGNQRCGCGRSLQVLLGLLGRTGEIFMTKDGRMISPNFWCRVFMTDRYAGQIRRFQVVYTKEKNLRVIIARGPGYSADAENHIRDMIRTNFSSDTRFNFEYVPDIKPHVSGKYQMVVNEAKA